MSAPLTAKPTDLGFYNDMRDLFQRTQSSHMSRHLYDDHAAEADGEPISGALMWHYAATREQKYYIARSDIDFLRRQVGAIASYIPHGLPLVDLGPGSLKAVENKSLALLKALESPVYQPIDASPKFARDSEAFIAQRVPGVTSAGKVADFLSPETQHDFDDDVVVYYGGATISNLIHPLTKTFPYEVLTTELGKLARLAKRGWIVISYDGIQDEKGVLEAYQTKYFSRFIRNIFYRVPLELSTRQLGADGFSDSFDPDGFTYQPAWVASAHLLANIVVANRDQEFTIGAERFRIREGDQFLVLNSYKFTPAIFEGCCAQAGIQVVERWTHDETPMELYLLRVNSAEDSQHALAPRRLVTTRSLTATDV